MISEFIQKNEEMNEENEELRAETFTQEAQFSFTAYIIMLKMWNK